MGDKQGLGGSPIRGKYPGGGGVTKNCWAPARFRETREKLGANLGKLGGILGPVKHGKVCLKDPTPVV